MVPPDRPPIAAPAPADRVVALAGVVIISFSAIWVALADTSPITAGFFRAAYALPVLVVVAAVTERPAARSDAGSRWIAVAAGMALALDFTVWHLSIDRIGAGLATALGNMQVVLVGVVGWAMLGERPRRITFLMLPLAVVGLVLVAGVGSSDPQGSEPVAGAVFGVLTAVFYALFLLTFRRAAQRSRSAVGPLRDATYGAVAGTLLLAPFDGSFSVIPSWPTHGWLLALALGSQVVGWLLIARSMPRLAALDTSMSLLLQPAGALLWGAWLLDERLAALQWIGIALVGVSIVVVGGRAATLTDPGGSRP